MDDGGLLEYTEWDYEQNPVMAFLLSLNTQQRGRLHVPGVTHPKDGKVHAAVIAQFLEQLGGLYAAVGMWFLLVACGG